MGIGGFFKKLNPVRPVKKGIDHMMKNMVLGIVRHVLTTGGGALVGRGVLAASDYEAAIGAVLTLAGIVWSVVEKRKTR